LGSDYSRRRPTQAAQIAERQVLRATGDVYEHATGLLESADGCYCPQSGTTTEGSPGPYVSQQAIERYADPGETETYPHGTAESKYRWVTFPAASGNRFRNYDYYRLEGESDWKFDHPVSLVIRCRKALSTKQVTDLFRGSLDLQRGGRKGLGYQSITGDIPKKVFNRVSYGRLEVDGRVNQRCWSTTTVLKRRPTAEDPDSFYHVRFYGPKADSTGSFSYRCAHHAKPNTDSTRSRTPVPRQAEQPFHGKPNTGSTPSRTVIGLDVEPLSGP